MGRNLGTHKDIEALARKARKQGWSVEVTNSNHLRFTPPQTVKSPTTDGDPQRRADRAKTDNAPPFVSAPLTPSDHRSIKAVMSKLRRAGLKLD